MVANISVARYGIPGREAGYFVLASQELSSVFRRFSRHGEGATLSLSDPRPDTSSSSVAGLHSGTLV